MEFNSWKYRRQVMAMEAADHHKFWAVVIADNIDWKTGKKAISSRVHLNNWLRYLHELYGAGLTVEGEAPEFAPFQGLTVLAKAGYAKLENGELVLLMQDDEAALDAA